MQNTVETAQARYHTLLPERQHFVDRGDLCASLTIPTLFRKNADGNKNEKIKDPHQSVGARGVTTMAAKMVLSLLPMNTPFFKMSVDDLALKLEGQGELKLEIEKGLGVIERGVLRSIEESGDVTVVNEVLKHLCVTGNVLLYVGEKTRMYDLNRYCTVRSPAGEVLETVIMERVAPVSLTPEQRALVSSTENSQATQQHVEVYTYIKMAGGRVKWHQEIAGKTVAGSESDVPQDANPWLALRFIRVDGEDYGRGYVEEYLGDLKSLEALTKAIVEGSAASAKVLFMVRPNGTTKARNLAESPNGAIVTGDANDVSTLQVQKGGDFRVAMESMNTIQERLNFAFLNNSSVQRNAERVTAEEVRFMAQELETALGGIYSILSQEFQMPLIKLLLKRLEKEGKMPKLPKDTVKPTIVTGIEALGRGQDLNKLASFLQYLQPLGPEVIASEMNIDDYISRLAASLGIDTGGLVKSPQQKQQEAQQAQAAQQQMMMQQTAANMAENATAPTINQVGKAVDNQ